QAVDGAMGYKILRIIGLVVMLMASLLSFAAPVSAEAPTWSAVPIPDTEGFQLGPSGVDIRDLAVAADGMTIYAAPGDSIADRYVFRSGDAGTNWVAQGVSIVADLVAAAPDNADVAVVARKTVPSAYLTTDGGATWRSLGMIQASGGSSAREIYDIAISEASNGAHYLAVAGEEVGGVGNVWYCVIEAEKPEWKETGSLPGFAMTRTIRALAFSPNFPEDNVLVTVGETEGKRANLQVFSFSSQAWNTQTGLSGYPVDVLEYDATGQVVSASIALSPDYLAGEESSRIAFVGLAVSGDEAAGGVYRIGDTTSKPLLTGIDIHGIAFNGRVLVAAAYDGNTVYRSTNPLTEVPTLRPNLSMKGPGGEGRVIVVWAGDVVVAGTSGDESAVAVSRNNGLAFNDVSLIDTTLSNLSDVAVAEDGEVIYLVSDDGNDLSLWRRTSSWQRVLSQQDTADYIIRLAPGDFKAVYLAEKDGYNIYHSSHGGDREWSMGTSLLAVQDLVVESADTAYVLNAEGHVSKTLSSGLAWSANVSTKLDDGTGHMVVSGGVDILFAGSTNGYVAYSGDGGASWQKISRRIQSGADRVQVVPDKDYASNKMIYAASDGGGQSVMRWQVGTSTIWADIFRGNLGGRVYGLAAEDNALYVLEYSPGAKQSTLWQCLSPTTATRSSASWEARATSTTTDVADPSVVFDASPQALKLSSGGRLWALKTNGTNRLYRINDVMTKLVLQAPDDGHIDPVNRVTGIAGDITFRWQRIFDATEYELSIAQDEEFKVPIARITATSDSSPVVLFVGPTAEGAAQIHLNAGTTYYWRVRITQPLFRISSEHRTFQVEALELTTPPVIIAPPPPPPVISIPPPPELKIPFPTIELPPTPLPPEVVVLPAPEPPAPVMPGYAWAIIGAGIAVMLTVLTFVTITFIDRFLIFWLRNGRYRWSRWRRRWFEAKYRTQPLPAADSLEQIEALLKQVTWTMDGPLHLFDAISYPQTVWAKKKDDCDGFAALAAALLQQWQPESRPVLVTAMLRPVLKSHTVCVFNVPGAGLWFFDNYSLRRGHYRTYADIAAEVRGKTRMVCWDVVEPDTLQTLEFHTASQ
ncbi:MAG: WD40 repeat domain-containing protein, partial [Dehalococcoidales bacterium]